MSPRMAAIVVSIMALLEPVVALWWFGSPPVKELTLGIIIGAWVTCRLQEEP